MLVGGVWKLYPPARNLVRRWGDGVRRNASTGILIMVPFGLIWEMRHLVSSLESMLIRDNHHNTIFYGLQGVGGEKVFGSHLTQPFERKGLVCLVDQENCGHLMALK